MHTLNYLSTFNNADHRNITQNDNNITGSWICFDGDMDDRNRVANENKKGCEYGDE